MMVTMERIPAKVEIRFYRNNMIDELHSLTIALNDPTDLVIKDTCLAIKGSDDSLTIVPFSSITFAQVTKLEHDE